MPLVQRAIDMIRPWCGQIVLALPEGYAWHDGVHSVVVGGASRIDTLTNAIAALEGVPDIVVIQDCVRPLMPASVSR